MRIIARIDIKAPNVIKGIQMEGLRVIGDPDAVSARSYEDGADEIIYLDTVATLYNRNHTYDLLKKSSRNLFVPITVAGGVRSVADARKLLLSGADKVALNTAAIERPELISELSQQFGSQSIVASVEAKRGSKSGTWEALSNNGREHTGSDVLDWVGELSERGAGEILVTSVDADGTLSGPDYLLAERCAAICSRPLIYSGGIRDKSELSELQNLGVDAVAIGAAFHFNRFSAKGISERTRG